MTERELQKAILNVLDAWPSVRAWRNQEAQGGRYRHRGGPCRVGPPDIEGYMADGKALGIEVKGDSGWKLTDEQRAYGEHMLSWGCFWTVVWSAEEVVTALLAWQQGGKAWTQCVQAAWERASTPKPSSAAAVPKAEPAPGASPKSKRTSKRTKGGRGRKANASNGSGSRRSRSRRQSANLSKDPCQGEGAYHA